MAVFFITACTTLPTSQHPPLRSKSGQWWYVRQIPACISEMSNDYHYVREEWCLYRGNPGTLFLDEYHYRSGQFAMLFFMHPVKDIRKADPRFNTESEWYFFLQVANANPTDPEDPFLKEAELSEGYVDASDVFKVIRRLGAKDPELLMISYSLHTRSIVVRFHPDHNTDREYYDEKLKLLIDE